MDDLADEFAPRGFLSFFVYTREAHPGELLPHHMSFDQKLAHARAFRDEQSVRRPILVDALDGSLHRLLGAMPNMVWIVLRGGTIAYKAAWTAPDDVRRAAEEIARIPELRRRGGRLAPIWTERLGYRVVDQAAFMRGLERNGPKAVAEFADFMRQSSLDRLDE